jgi:hypothetical protein
MGIVQEHIAHLEAMKNSVEDVVREIITEHAGEIIDLVRFRQLAKGLNSENKPLSWAFGTGLYAKSTQGLATAQGLAVPKTAGSPYNFQWTGDTFDSMGFKLTTKAFELFTVDGKQRMLEGIYGEIFNLTEENNALVNQHIIQPELIKWIDENWWRLNT